MITTEQIKSLRDATGISVMQCKKALEEAGGNMEKALIILRKKGVDIAAKKSGRSLGAGVIASYIHGNGSSGAMVELSCETDFVAKNEEFKTMARDIAMHIVAMNPVYIKAEDVGEDAKSKAREVFEKEVKDKPKTIQEKIMQGKLASYFAEKILLEQTFVKNSDLTVKGLIDSGVQKFGEKIEVARFARFSVLDK